MTDNADFKALVRQRMTETGESYTVALTQLRARAPRAASDAGEVPAAPGLDAEAARAEQELAVRRLFRDGRLTQIPARRRTRVHALLELVSWFEPGREYTEKQVNEILARADDDVAYLRRELVEYGYVTRADGRYRLADAPPARSVNVAQEIPDWEAVWLPGYLAGTPTD